MRSVSGLTGLSVLTALQFGDWGAVGFSGVDLRRRDLLMPVRDSRSRAAPTQHVGWSEPLSQRCHLSEGTESAKKGMAEGTIDPAIHQEVRLGCESPTFYLAAEKEFRRLRGKDLS